MILLLCSFLIVPFVSIVVFTKMGDFIFRATNRFIVSLCVYMPVCLYVCVYILTSENLVLSERIWESCQEYWFAGFCYYVWRSHLKTR